MTDTAREDPTRHMSKRLAAALAAASFALGGYMGFRRDAVLAVGLVVLLPVSFVPELPLALLHYAPSLAAIGFNTLGFATEGILPLVLVLASLPGFCAALARRQYRLRYLLNNHTVPLLAFLCALVLSSAFPPSGRHAIEKAQMFLVFNAVPFFVIVVLPQRNRERLLEFMLMAGILLAGVGWSGYLRDVQPTIGGRYTAWNVSPIAGARLQAVALLVLWFWMRWAVLVKGLASIVLGGALLLTGTRGVVVSLILVLVSDAVFGTRSGAWPRKRWAVIGRLSVVAMFILVVGGVMSSSIGTPAYVNVHGYWGPTRLVQGVSPSLDDPNVTSRLRSVVTAFRAFAVSPLRGVGLGGFADIGVGVLEHPHNATLEILAELGALGFLPYAVLVVQSVRTLRSPLRSATAQGERFNRTVALLTAFVFASAHLSSSFVVSLPLWLVGLVIPLHVPAGRERLVADRQ